MASHFLASWAALPFRFRLLSSDPAAQCPCLFFPDQGLENIGGDSLRADVVIPEFDHCVVFHFFSEFHELVVFIIVSPASLGSQIFGVAAHEGQHPDIGVGLGHLILLMPVALISVGGEGTVPAAQEQHVDVGVIEPVADVVELAAVGGHEILHADRHEVFRGI